MFVFGMLISNDPYSWFCCCGLWRWVSSLSSIMQCFLSSHLTCRFPLNWGLCHTFSFFFVVVPDGFNQLNLIFSLVLKGNLGVGVGISAQLAPHLKTILCGKIAHTHEWCYCNLTQVSFPVEGILRWMFTTVDSRAEIVSLSQWSSAWILDVSFNFFCFAKACCNVLTCDVLGWWPPDISVSLVTWSPSGWRHCYLALLCLLVWV